MAITKRLVKGSALSHTELDGNFTDYETFKALFDSTTFTGPNDGKLLFWNNSTSKVEVKTATTSELTLRPSSGNCRVTASLLPE